MGCPPAWSCGREVNCPHLSPTDVVAGNMIKPKHAYLHWAEWEGYIWVRQDNIMHSIVWFLTQKREYFHLMGLYTSLCYCLTNTLF